MKMKLTSVAITLLVALFILSVSIAMPIIIRPFYYLHIDAYDIPESTGLSVEEIKLAYNDMMDYCLGLRSDFSAGKLPFSDEGVAHFDDVRALFFVDFAVLIASALLLAAIIVIFKVKKLTPHRFLGRSPQFWSVASIVGVGSLIGIACAIDFDGVFEIFHKIFFIGKTNWKFKISKDPIITILPSEFFANCAIFIFATVIAISIAIILYEFIPRRKKKIS